MPPTTEEFEKLLALRRCLHALAADDATSEEAGEEMLDLLPRLRDVFGPAFPPSVHERLDGLESGLREGTLTPAAVRAHGAAIAAGLGIAFLDPAR